MKKGLGGEEKLAEEITRLTESSSCAEKSKSTAIKGHVLPKSGICISSGLRVQTFFFSLHTCRSAELLQHCLTASSPRVAISSLPLGSFLSARCGERISVAKASAFLRLVLVSAWGFSEKLHSQK